MDCGKIGLKSGLEIHQQIDSHKLFCECPSVIRTDEAHLTIKRELRPLAGETGKIDPAALFEKKKRKFYIYEAYSDTTCPVELDEEPPHPINQEALDIALLIAKMLHCEILDVVQVMRKTIVDGSNVSGFQRTALIGLNGYVETSFGKVGIQTIAIEEDAARRISETPDSVTWRLDRLGIPLVEIATAPDCKTPEQVKETAEKIGLLLRSTGKVMRGIGTIRQDVNVSITGHPRVELKGVQELPHMPEIVKNEIERQIEAIKKGEKLEPQVRNILPDLKSKFLRPMAGAARMYPETDIPLIKIDKERVARMKLPESFEEREKKFIKLGLSEDLAKQAVRDVKLKFIESLLSKFKIANPNTVVSTILSVESEVKRKTGNEVKFSDEQFESVLELLDKGKIAKEALLDIFISLSKGEKLSEITKKFAKLSDTELKKEIEKLKSQLKDIPKEKLQGVIIGKLRGKAEPKKIIELL
ncbi:MAG: Glu-tRNA(Gln) amidotransferase subunit GatE [Candidatus Nanoarchaeia archaeon]